jgi:hypothetical protein
MIIKNPLLARGTFLTLALAAVLPALLAQPVRAQSPESPQSGFRTFAGLKTLDIGEQRFRHDTHPDDSFLPDSDVPGSAGETNVGGTHFYATFGGGYRARLSDLFSLTIDAGILLGVGNNRDRHQNDNDNRPAASGTFVYSEAGIGWCVSADLSCRAGRYDFGIEAQLANVIVEHGWDRFGEHESRHRQTEHFLSAGPRIGRTLSESILVDGTVQFGRGVTFGARIIWMF